MRERRGQARLSVFLAGLAAALVSPAAFAVIECPGSLEVKDSACDSKYSQPSQKSQKQQCKQKCQKAKQDCQSAAKACSSGKAQESQNIAEGQQSSAGAGGGASGLQGEGGTQAPNAANMCSGQKANQGRADAGKPIPAAMKKCQSSASECEDPSASEAASKAGSSAAQVSQENASRLAEASQMGQKCGQSKSNENQMGQTPQMPQQGSGQGEESAAGNESPTSYPDFSTGSSDPLSSPSGESPIASAGEEPATPGGSVGDSGGRSVEAVHIGPAPLSSSGGADVAIDPSTVSSELSGATIPGGGGGSASLPGEPGFSSSGFPGTPGSGFSGRSLAGGAGLGSSSSSSGGAAQPAADSGIAPADIKPADAGVYEVSAAGGRSLLGLKAKSGGDDELGRDLALKPGSLVVKRDGKGTAGRPEGPRVPFYDESTSLFSMVRARYRYLKENGQI